MFRVRTRTSVTVVNGHAEAFDLAAELLSAGESVTIEPVSVSWS